MSRLLVNKSNLRELRIEQHEPGAIQDGQVSLAVDEFALTSNNVTYAITGQRMGYWDFFPAPEGWGCIPAWGFATVAASRHPDVREGERFFGYLPMGTSLVVTAGCVSASQVMDTSAHRSHLAAGYNQLHRVDSEQHPESDAMRMLFEPLFVTSWLLSDFLADNGAFGASQVLITSASSKTSLGLAYLLQQQGERTVIGLTSERHQEFVREMDCYDVVYTYEEIDSLDACRPTVAVDMAGNGATLFAIHRRYGEQLKHSCLVGATHWRNRAGATGLSGPRPTLFFGPAHMASRSKRIGSGEMRRQYRRAWQVLTEWGASWVEILRIRGLERAAACYLELLDGSLAPQQGLIVAPNQQAEPRRRELE